MASKKPKIVLKKPQTKKPGVPGKKPVDPKSMFQFKRAGKTSFVWLLIIVGAIIISGIFSNSSKKEIEVEYFQYRIYIAEAIYDFQGTIFIQSIFQSQYI